MPHLARAGGYQITEPVKREINGEPQVVDAPSAGAPYSYPIIARGKDLGMHNPTYTKQLLWDSLKQIEGHTYVPVSLPARPQ